MFPNTFGNVDSILLKSHFELDYAYGSLADGANNHSNVITSYVHGINLRVVQRINFNKYPWQSFLRYPNQGFQFSYFDLGNSKLGSAFLIKRFIDIYLLDKQRFSWNIEASIGGGYFTKVFDPENNFENTFISNRFNFAFGFRSYLRYHVLPKISIHLGVQFDHFSNGETRIPNEGLNSRALVAGVKWGSPWQYRNRPIYHAKKDSLAKKWVHQIQISTGRKENWRYGDRKYWIQNLSYSYIKILNPAQRLGLGIDLFYDQSDQFYSNRNLDPADSFTEALNAGVHLSHDFNLYPVHIVLQLGHYIAGKRSNGDGIYQMMGIKYYLNEMFYLSMIHKSHFFFRGDHIAWGIGLNI